MTAAGRLKQFARRAIGPAVVTFRPRRVDLFPEHWGLTVSVTGALTVDDVPLRELPSRFGSPMHLVDGARLVSTADGAATRWGRGVVCATARLIGVGGLLAELHRSGAGVVVCSESELDEACRAGVPAADVLYAEAVPTGASLAAAARAGVATIFLPSPGAVDRLLGMPGADVSSVGVSVEASPSRSRSMVACEVGDDLNSMIRRMLSAEHVSLDSLRVVVGQSVRSERDARAVVASVRSCVQAVVEGSGWRPTRILVTVEVACPTTSTITPLVRRLNRTFGADLVAPDPTASLAPEVAVDRIVTALGAAFPPDVCVSIEPGSGLTASSQMLLTTVLDVKDDRDQVHVVLDAGINLASGTATEFHQLFNASRHGSPGSVPSRLVGPICTPADVLVPNWRLPEVRSGDVIAIMDVGSGFVPTSTSFSFGRPAVVLQRAGRFEVVRRAETYEDLVALDQFRYNGSGETSARGACTTFDERPGDEPERRSGPPA